MKKEEEILEACLPAVATLAGNLNPNLPKLLTSKSVSKINDHAKPVKFWSIMLQSYEHPEQFMGAKCKCVQQFLPT